jgi:hypothetical protein
MDPEDPMEPTLAAPRPTFTLRIVPTLQSPSELVLAMRADLLRFAELARREGANVLAFEGELDPDTVPPRFAALPPDVQAMIHQRFKVYVEVCESLAATGVSLRDDRQFLWAMIKRLGVTPSSTLFTLLDESDVIEIYDMSELVQVFRNFRFYDVCSYSLDDVLSRPWFELYRRDAAVTYQIQGTVQRCVQSGSTEPIFYDVGVHELVEVDSPSMIRSVIENRFVAGLLDAGGAMIAGVNVVRPIAIDRDVREVGAHRAAREGATRRPELAP